MAESKMSGELEQIIAIIKNHPAGVSIADIEKQLSHPLPRRTLLRRLVALKEMGQIRSHGDKSATRYVASNIDVLLPLSKEAQSLKVHVNLPIQQREPVAYQSNFLYDYQPNKTFYLSQAQREHLKEQGQQFNHELEPGTYIKRMFHRLLIDLSWNSSRLEGNTYSLIETERLIEFGAEANSKAAFETQMILNHKAAIEFVVECSQDLKFSEYIVLNVHGLLSNNLLANPKARGRLRQIPVGIGRTTYHPPEIPQLINECFQYILKIANEINDPFEQAFFVMVHLPYLQPFEDVNKRVSRLVANIPLIKHNLSPLSFVDVPQSDYVSGLLAIYELNKIELMRDVFMWAYERSAKQYKLVRNALGEPNIFHMRFREELKSVVNFIIANNTQRDRIVEAVQIWVREHIPDSDQAQFIRLAEKEIAGLHMGNIAIYDIKPEVFNKWRGGL